MLNLGNRGFFPARFNAYGIALVGICQVKNECDGCYYCILFGFGVSAQRAFQKLVGAAESRAA